jgi:hypothetical protein
MAASDDSETGFNPRRRLCPDGSCIGLIGDDGRCTVCGCAAPQGQMATEAAASEAEDDDFYQSEEAADDASADVSADASGFDPGRRLCSDDACIGVIGSDDRCTECGKPAAGWKPAAG